MSIISDAFNKLLELEEGEKLQIGVTGVSQLHSYRTMFYKEASLFKHKTGIKLPVSCEKKIVNGKLVLEVMLKSVNFKVVGEQNDATR